MARAYYHKGLRLFDVAQEAPAWAARTGAMVQDGLHQTYPAVNPESPNFQRAITVRTVVPPIRENVLDFALEDSIENTLHKVEEFLIANAGSAGHLAWCPDNRRRCAVTTGAAAGDNRAVVVATPAGGWVPRVGGLVLLRERTGMTGFVTEIENWVPATGTFTMDLDATVANTGWEALDVARAITEVVFKTMDGGKLGDPHHPKRSREEITYQFEAFGAVLFPADSLLPGYTD